MLGLQQQLGVLRNSDAVLIRTASGKVLYEGYTGNTEYCSLVKDQEVLEVHLHFNPQRKGTKEKLKMQIQKCRNNTREVFVSDYENWIRHEAQGGMCLSKPVREIMATYCPFTKELREKVSDMPIYRDAMARFQRERGEKLKEYDLKFKVWQKDGMDVPQEVVHTRDFYLEF